MSKFLDELFTDLAQPENDQTDEVATEANAADEVEETTEPEDGDSEEIADVDATPEASEEVEADDDDEKGEIPADRKVSYGRLKALLDEREKRQSAEAERDRLNEQLAEMHRQREAANAQNLPDPHDDPTGYVAAREAQYQEQLTRQALGFSIQRAVEKHGNEEVEAAAKWFENQMATNPHIPLRQNMLSQPDQMDYVVSSYKQAQKVSAITSGDYSSLVAELQKAGYNISKADPTVAAPAAPVTQTVAATPATPVLTAPAAPKRSKLATASTATTAPPSNVSMMDAVLRRK